MILKVVCYYFDDIIRFWDINIYSSYILLDKKLYKEKDENILIHDISYKTSMGAKPLHIMFYKIHGFIKIHNKMRCLVLFNYERFDEICDNIKYLMLKKWY